MVDTTIVVVHEAGSGNPMYYLAEAQIAETGNEDALRMVEEYDPSWEFVTGLLKSKEQEERESFYRVGVPSVRPRK